MPDTIEQDAPPVEQDQSPAPEAEAPAPEPETEPQPSRRDQLLEGMVEDDEPGGEPTPIGTNEPADAPQMPDFLSELSELGFQDVNDETEAQRRLLDSYRQTQSQIEEMRTDLDQYRTLAQYGQQYLQQQQQPQQEQQSGEPSHWWSPPQFEAEWLTRYREAKTDPETGQVTWHWKENTPPEIRSNTEAYQAYTEKWADDLVTRPQQVLPKIIEQEFDRLFEERYGARVQEQQTEQFIEQLKRENGDWLYQRDPRTNEVAYDPRTNQPLLSQRGQQAFGLITKAENLGITDPRAQWEYVTDMMQVMDSRQQQPQQQAQPSTAIDRRMQHLQQGVNSIPDRGGSVPQVTDGPAMKQNPNLSAGQKLLQQLQADGQI